MRQTEVTCISSAIHRERQEHRTVVSLTSVIDITRIYMYRYIFLTYGIIHYTARTRTRQKLVEVIL
jgi:hypothetical protein